MMRHIILPFLLSLSFVALPLFAANQPVQVQAQDNEIVTRELCKDEAVADSCDNSLFGEGGLILNVANILIRVVAAVSVLVIVISGLMYILSGGDSNKVQRAKDALLYAVIGLVVALAAQGIVSFVLNTAS